MRWYWIPVDPAVNLFFTEVLEPGNKVLLERLVDILAMGTPLLQHFFRKYGVGSRKPRLKEVAGENEVSGRGRMFN